MKRRGAIRRRLFLGWAGLSSTTFVSFAACGSLASDASPAEGAVADSHADEGAVDFAWRFAAFEVASEPEGDLAKVVWPAYVLQAGPEIKRLYEYQVVNGDLMRWMPCFCGCGTDAHRNNRDCYIQEVNSDGSVVFDSMAPGCEVCKGVTRQAMAMQAEGKTPRQIRAAIDARYAAVMSLSTPTPYPPA